VGVLEFRFFKMYYKNKSLRYKTRFNYFFRLIAQASCRSLRQQIAELCDDTYQACRKMAGSKRSLWEKLRTFVFESQEQLLHFYYDVEGYDVIDGYMLARQSP